MSGNLVYAIAIAQFLLGAIITVVNLVLWLAIAVNPALRTAPHCLLCNMWFANLLLGVIVAISNVVDQSDAYVFQKTEGTIAIVNGIVTVSMLLALTTSRVVMIRNPSKAMSTKTSYKIIIVTWAAVLTLTLVKAIVYGLHQIGTVDACFRCFLSFEVSMLVIFAAATLITFFVAVYLIRCHRSRTVGDSSGPNANTVTPPGGNQKEYRMILTIGLLLLGFTVTFLAFVFLIPAWLTNGYIDPDAAEVIITLFYTHCLINPVIALIRDVELRKSACRVLRCQRPSGDGPPIQQTTFNGSSRSIHNQQHTLEIIDTEPRYQQPVPNGQPNQNQKPTVLLPPIEAPLTARNQFATTLESIDEPKKFNETNDAKIFEPTAPPMESEQAKGQIL